MKFRQWEVIVEKARYSSDRIAIVLNSPDGERVAVATVNLPEYPLGRDEVFVKTWSENEGMMEFLESNGIAKSTGETFATGYATATKAKLIV